MAIPAVCDDSSALPQCPGCRQRDARIIQLEQQLVALQAENRKLAERVGRNAFNSSIPPSAQPLDAPKFPKKKPSGRNRGGQPGHRARTRTLLPTTHVDAVVPFVPANCERCQAPLAAEPQAGDPPPHRHQIVELPPQLIHVTEYQGQARTCATCGHVTWAVIPAAVRAHATGPRLVAVVSYLTGCQHISKRGVTEFCTTVLGAPMALGTVANLEREMSAALAPAHAEAAQAVQQARVKNVDETSWKLAGALLWLWTAATRSVALYLIVPSRGWSRPTTTQSAFSVVASCGANALLVARARTAAASSNAF